jgi:beta-lactamase regulating signal transducer with metallopeptidase domain
MSDFLATLVPALGHALVQFTWQGLVSGALAALSLRIARDARPQVRYAIACMAMLACVLVPLASVLWQFGDVAPASLALRDAMPVRVAGTGVVPMAAKDTFNLDAWLPRIVALWAAGASVLCLRTLFGMAWVRRMRMQPQAPMQARWQATLDALAQRFELQGVALRMVDALDSPVAAGWWRPVVLLPVSVALQLPATYVEALLAHELAHVRRHDYLVNLLQRAIEALLFFHPVTWWLSRRVRIERELIADRLAADAIGDPQRLARALAALSDLAPPSPALPHLAHAAHGGHLMSRIQHLIRSVPRDRQPAGRIALPLIGIAAACIAFYAQAQINRQDAEKIAPVVAAEVAASAPAIAEEAAKSASASAAAAASQASEAAAAAAAEAPRIAEAVAAQAHAIAADAANSANAMATQAAEASIVATQAAAQATQATQHVQVAQAAKSAQEASYKQYGTDDRNAWALVRKNEAGYSMSGSTRDMRQIDAAKRAMHDDFLWFRRDGKAYVIDDPAIVARAQAHWKDSEALGERMSALGDQMEVHGKKMEALGAQMEKLSVNHIPSPAMQQAQERMGAMADQQQELAGRQQLLAMKMRKADGAEEEKLDREMDALSKQMDALGDQMEAQGKIIERESAKLEQNAAPMEAIGKQMEQASKPMDALGKQMGELGKQQEQLARKAEKATNALITEAMQKGLARPAPQKQ